MDISNTKIFYWRNIDLYFLEGDPKNIDSIPLTSPSSSKFTHSRQKGQGSRLWSQKKSFFSVKPLSQTPVKNQWAMTVFGDHNLIWNINHVTDTLTIIHKFGPSPIKESKNTVYKETLEEFLFENDEVNNDGGWE